jgi:O-antigen ligase
MLTLRFARSNLAAIKARSTVLAILIICFSLILPFRPEVFLGGLFGGIVSSAGRDFTLTGRTDLWYDLLKIASHHRLVGVGYGSFWIGGVSHSLWDTHYWLPTQAHNGYLDVYVELGLLGLAILVAVLFSGIRAVTEALDTYFEDSQLRITLVIVLLLHNITESSFLKADHHLWFLFLLITLRPPAPLGVQTVPPIENDYAPAYMLPTK